jgi:rubrerythrin
MELGEKINALELALTNEMNEREFYLRHAERTRNELGRTMLGSSPTTRRSTTPG